MKNIATSDLVKENIPEKGASWNKIIKFAQTFNAYNEVGSFSSVAEIGNDKSTGVTMYTVDELRTVLFFEYRRHNHFGYDPEPEKMRKIYAVLDEIRHKV